MVYKGIYRRSTDSQGVEVAVKTIKSNQATDNFLKEMRVMSMLIHPNIVHLHGLVNCKGNECSGVQNPHRYNVMHTYSMLTVYTTMHV